MIPTICLALLIAVITRTFRIGFWAFVSAAATGCAGSWSTVASLVPDFLLKLHRSCGSLVSADGNIVTPEAQRPWSRLREHQDCREYCKGQCNCGFFDARVRSAVALLSGALTPQPIMAARNNKIADRLSQKSQF